MSVGSAASRCVHKIRAPFSGTSRPSCPARRRSHRLADQAAVAMMLGAGVATAQDLSSKHLHRSHHQTHAMHHKVEKHYASKHSHKHYAVKHDHKQHFASKHGHKHYS